MIEQIKKTAVLNIKKALDLKGLEDLRIKYLGRKGELTRMLRGLKDLSLAERRRVGPAAQHLKKELERLIAEKKNELITNYQLPITSRFDVTRPGHRIKLGHIHPLTKIEEEIRHIFLSLNFSVVEGPEVETEYYNFDALNIPPDHPARDMWDTFWLKQSAKSGLFARSDLQRKSDLGQKNGRLLLRTHTSPMQIRYMETHNPPFQIIVPGVVYRHEASDATHAFQFMQIEGLMVGKDVSLANFKYIIEVFLKKLFGSDLEFRLVPHHYPFVEPGVDVYMKFSGKWLEVAGAGMVHRKVFEAVKYNPYEWQGFAFGFGLTRLAMIKYNIPDIRLFYSGDLRFIEQF
ncbi:phenylalanine--tRNA ligase subunit alpha [Candidatus Wolfebacteria bacterium]|nr:phenylalanine--tRNA ligase subunit alpha [Candidatus Wolfebacteria bacterium]